jgi:tetratricopeptide (TPR) repeat protein
LCDEALAEFSSYSEVWFLKGRAHAELGQSRLAFRALKRALRLNSKHGPTAYELTKILYNRGRSGMATAMAKHALELGVDAPFIHDIAAGRPGPPPTMASSRPWSPAPTIVAGQVSPRAERAACRGVFLIVGSSYCGSTLLNILLGSHPKVVGGGELHWLVHESAVVREREGGCVFCGNACKIWTPEVRNNVNSSNLYDVTARAFSKPIVCDASKMPDWSSFMATAAKAPMVRILLVKHPLRHVASFVEKARRLDYMKSMTSIDRILDQLTKRYIEARTERVDILLRYEDLVSGPRAATTELLAKFDLDYDPAMENWRTAEHHYIGGNAGPRSQIAPTNRPDGGFLQRKYNRDDVFIDDSFATVLSPEEIERVLKHPLAKAMIKDFGYEPEIIVQSASCGRSMDAPSAETSLRRAPVRLIGPFEPDGGYRFLARLELLPQHLYLAAMADTEQAYRRSPLILLQDGLPLGPAHTAHRDIADLGEGRFSHWNDVLYFSTSDNSDPNTNGRKYSVGL